MRRKDWCDRVRAAIVGGDAAAVRELVAERRWLDQPVQPGRTALALAAEHGKIDIVKLLIAAGANVHACAREGDSPIVCAARRGRVEIVRILIAAGVDVNATNSTGGTPLVAAAGEKGKSYFTIVRELLAAGADPHLPNGDGHTPVMAAARGEPETLRSLVAAAAGLNTVSATGTPLTLAIQDKRADNVAVLIALGADAHLRLPDDHADTALAGKTAVELARELKLKKITRLLGDLPPEEPETTKPQRDVSAADVADLWQRIRSVIASHRDIAESLRSGAHARQIVELERFCGVDFSEDFRASLGTCDGQSEEADGLIPASFAGEQYLLLGIDGIESEWGSWKSLAEIGQVPDTGALPDDGVRPDWWNARWIPFASRGAGTTLCIDLAPADAGTVGQVISMSHEDGRRARLAPSFAHFLLALAEHLEESADA